MAYVPTAETQARDFLAKFPEYDVRKEDFFFLCCFCFLALFFVPFFMEIAVLCFRDET